MKLIKIDEVWNSANPLFKWRFGLLSSRNFAPKATWGNDFSFLLWSNQTCVKPSHFGNGLLGYPSPHWKTQTTSKFAGKTKQIRLIVYQEDSHKDKKKHPEKVNLKGFSDSPYAKMREITDHCGSHTPYVPVRWYGTCSYWKPDR